MEITEDSSLQEFWEDFYLAGWIPWDAGGVPDELQHYLTSASQHTGRVLIPGCGVAHEARAFLEANYQVTAIDFCQAAVDFARRNLGPLQNVVSYGDFFTYEFPPHSFDIIYERAFLCSLPRHLWPRYTTRLTELLHPKGSLIGFFFFGDQEEGPPFGLKPGELSVLLGDTFRLVSDFEVKQSVPVYAGGERWQEWRCGGLLKNRL